MDKGEVDSGEGLNHATVEERDGVVYYRASALGNCIRSLVALRQGYDEIRKELSVFHEGHLHEDDILARLPAEYHVLARQVETEVFVSSKIRVRGHVDAYGIGPGSSEVLIEAKSQSRDEYKAFQEDWSHGFWPKYKWQVSAYMVAKNMPLLIARKNRDSGEVTTRLVTKPFYSETEIRARVLQIESLAKSGELPPCDSEMYPCPVYYLHEAKEVALLEDAVLADLAQQYDRALVEAKQAESRKKELDKAIRAGMGGHKKVVLGDGTSITTWGQNPPERWDDEKLRELIEETGRKVEEFRSRGGKYSRLKVTLGRKEQ